jgi:hypothetical protein
MMKVSLLLVALIGVGLLGLFNAPTPVQAVDNVTIMSWPQMEVTLDDTTVGTISDVADSLSVLSMVAAYLFELFLMFGVIFLALWQSKRTFLKIIAFLITFFVAYDFFEASSGYDVPLGISLALAALSLYFLWIAVVPLFGKDRDE